MEQLEVLKDDAHLLAKSGDATAAQSQHALAKDVGTFGVLGIDVKLAVDGLQQRTLTRADTADEVDKLTLVDLKIDILQDEFLVLVYIGFLIIDKHLSLSIV